MANKVIQLKRYSGIYPNKDNALANLNAYVTNNISTLRDGEPIIGRYYEGEQCKVLVGVIHRLGNDSVKGVNWINLNNDSQSLTPADPSIDITDEQIKLNLKADADNILKVGDDGTYVSLQEILDAVPATDLSGIEAKIGKIHELGFGEAVTEDTTAEELYAEDDRLSAATSMVDADKILSKAIDDNSLVTAAAMNNLNTRSNILSGDVESVISRLDSVDINIETLNDKIENLDVIDVNNTLTKTSAITEDGKVVYTIGVIIDDSLDEDSSLPVANSAVTTIIRENEEVVAAALNDLNGRLIGLEGNTVTEITSDTLKIERTGGSVNIDFEDGIIDFGEY